MSIQVKPASTWRTTTQPWVKVAGVYQKATKVYVKIDGVWRESWPLQPGPVTNVITTTTYRNDRIEVDASWTAPTTGETVAKYFATIVVPGSLSVTVVVNAPSVALTYTNNGAGVHHLAGKGVYVSVYAQSTAGRNGDAGQSSTTPIAQLPAPAVPSTYTVTCVACNLTHTWANESGRTVDGVELQVLFNNVGPTIMRYADTVKTATYESWNPATVGGGTVTSRVRTYGPGGTSAWKTVTGTLPSPVGTSSYRFGNGYLRVNTSGINPHVQVHTLPYGGSYSGPSATFAAGATEVYDPDSSGWARNRTFYGMLLRPINNVNGWTGRDQWLGWAMKIPNPTNIAPIDSATRRGSAWRSEVDQDWQGSSSAGTNVGYFFYGNQFYDYLSTADIGYDVGITSVYIAMRRETSGQTAAVPPMLMLHRAGRSTEDLAFGGTFSQTTLARNETKWVVVPASWGDYLKERRDGWKGLGVYESDHTLLSGLGNVSLNYSIYTAWNYGTIESGVLLDTVRIYHNG